MAGKGKRIIVYIPEMQEPEPMYKLFDGVVGTMDDLLGLLDESLIQCKSDQDHSISIVKLKF